MDSQISEVTGMESKQVQYLDEDSIRLVVLGEASSLSTAILRGSQRSSGSLRNSASVPSRLATMVAEYEEEEDEDEAISDPLLKSLIRLKAKLRKDKLVVTDHNYLRPFCDVIKNKDVSGPVTGLALQSILKFINYGLIKRHDSAVQMVADSVTKARFIGTDSSSDEVVLMRILNVLHQLVVCRFECLSNNSICEIMQSCFRIAFEPRLSELLRKSSEQALVDMVQVLFQRIGDFPNDDFQSDFKMSGKFNVNIAKKSKNSNNSASEKANKTNQTSKEETEKENSNQYYGLACIHELLCYLTSLINPLPEAQNSESMIGVGLTLLTVAFETCIHSIGSKNCLLTTVKNDLCWNIMLLLQTERPINSFAASLRLAFLIYTNLRMHLKYQFEALVCRLMDIISTGNVFFEFREIALEYLVAFFRHLSHLPHELYLNYDCDPYASNLLEDLLQLFSKNCFATSIISQPNANNASQVNSFSSMQMLSLDALLANLKSLQKAEICSNHWLNVFPSAIVRTETIKTNCKVPISESLSISPSEDSAINIIESPSAQPEDVDVGVASSDAGDIPGASMSSVGSISSMGSMNAVNESIIGKEKEKLISNELIEETLQHNHVTYQFPKPEKVPHTLNDIDLQKQKKRLLWMASEQFNTKPSKGIQFMQENHLANDEIEIVSFLRDNPKLDKKQIGEYLSNKKNIKILKAFVESFAFKGLRVDESLRMYLESFRLPGESPLISMILEQFAHHWHESNDCPFENEDAAFSLAYAIIMLNVDQHNTNVKRQTNPMTCEEFISNLRQVNGGKDFDSNMLKETYRVIKTNEIIMPAEQQGIVRERYLWKCLLRKSETDNGAYWFMKDKSKPLEQMIKIDSKELEDQEKYLQVKLSTLNGPIFSVLWGPTVAAMTFIFDKINPDQHSGLTKRILNNGFNSCALLCATYGHLDNLIVSLSKFIQSSSNTGSPIMTIKSQLAAQCLFSITREYANEMRESWSNIIELILHWYMARLLDNAFEFEDFALNSKKVTLKRKDKKLNSKNSADAGTTFLSSFYSYFAGSQNEAIEADQSNVDSMNERDASNTQMAKEENIAKKSLNTYWQPLLLIIEDSKFLHIDSLLELIKALINVHIENTDENDDDMEVFKLEILVQIILMNRDRVSVFWPQIFRYLLRLFRICPTSEYLNERVISAIFRLAIRFVPRPDFLSEQIFQVMSQILATFEPSLIQTKYSATSLHSFVSLCHSYITKREDWELIFNLLLYIGIGYQKPQMKSFIESESYDAESLEADLDENAKSKSCDDISNITKSSRGYTSDSEVKQQDEKQITPNIITPFRPFQSGSTHLSSSFKILNLEAYEKCTEILTLIIREILPANEEQCTNKQEISSIAQLAVDVLQKYAEASVKIQISPGKSGQLRRSASQGNFHRRSKTSKSRTKTSDKSRFSRIATAILSSSESDGESEETNLEKQPDDKNQPKLSSVTETCSLKLLDLMHYLHLNASVTVHGANDALWSSLWCPLLQGIALFCCDARRPVRTCALTFLQRALLLHDLKVLSASQWEDCFNKVLFPLLSKLLEPLNMYDPIGMDETRMRTTNLLCKVFLQHLTPLVTLPTFTALWLTILDFMDRYIKAEMQTDYVREAIPESLKNILLVMDTAGCFNDTLAAITWDRLAIFLPNLRQELMPQPVVDNINPTVSTQPQCNDENVPNNQQQPSDSQPALPNSTENSSEIAETKPIQTTQHKIQQAPVNYQPPSYVSPSHSTFITIDENPNPNPSPNPNPKMFPQSQSPFGFPGSSVIASPLPNATQNASVYFPQPASAYPWPAPK